MKNHVLSPSTQKELVQFQFLLDLAGIMDDESSLQDVLPKALELLTDKLDGLRAAIMIADPDCGDIHIAEAYGLSEEQKQLGHYARDEGIVGQVIREGKPLLVPSVRRDPRFADRIMAKDLPDQYDVSYLCLPLLAKKKAIGALSLIRRTTGLKALENQLPLLSVVTKILGQTVLLRQEAEHAAQGNRVQADEIRRLREQLHGKFRPDRIIGNAKPIERVYDLIRQVCSSETTVLLTGESGVGKELVAHAIHYNSLRMHKPFVRVNCAALPESMLESELFGHERGAFTGATQRRLGRFERADGGTLFLDEVGDFSPAIQVALLRVLQEREIERVGGNRLIPVDVRIIAATNRNLEEMVAAGQFRKDLFYRLNVFPIRIPPLRERKTDIPLLADHFALKFGKRNHKEIKRIASTAIDLLVGYPWPGNIRELENCIERAVLLTRDGVIHGHHLPPTLQTAGPTGTMPRDNLVAILAQVERDVITDALIDTRGNCAKAARILGLTERVMGLRIKKYNLDPTRFR